MRRLLHLTLERKLTLDEHERTYIAERNER